MQGKGNVCGGSIDLTRLLASWATRTGAADVTIYSAIVDDDATDLIAHMTDRSFLAILDPAGGGCIYTDRPYPTAVLSVLWQSERTTGRSFCFASGGWTTIGAVVRMIADCPEVDVQVGGAWVDLVTTEEG